MALCPDTSEKGQVLLQSPISAILALLTIKATVPLLGFHFCDYEQHFSFPLLELTLHIELPYIEISAPIYGLFL